MKTPLPVSLKRSDHPAMLFTAILLAAFVAVGFAKTYIFTGLVFSTLPSPVVHLHAALFVGWIVLLLVQIGFAASGHLRWHRKLGSFMFFWAIGMILVGPPTLIMAVRRPGSGLGAIEVVADLGQLLLFAVLVYRAFAARRTRPDVHKRLMLLATATLMLPALSRWPWDIPLLVFALLYLAAPAALIVWDLVSLRRVHASTWFGTSLMVLLFVAAVLIARTPQAASLVNWIRQA